MTKESKNSARIKKCILATELYTFNLSSDDDEMILELPKPWFRGMKHPKEGSIFTTISNDGDIQKILIDNFQVYPVLNPLSGKVKKCKKTSDYRTHKD